MKQQVAYILSLVLLSAACSQVPDFHKPEVNSPAQWTDQSHAAIVSDLTGWWQKFKSNELLAIEGRALQQNLDLAAAQARIDQARAAETVAASALFPQADLSTSLSKGVSHVAGGKTSRSSSVSAGLNISYDADLFGGNRAARTAAAATVAGSIFDRESIALSVSADVAKTYADILALEGRVYIAQENRKTLSKTLDILKARFKAGAASGLDLEQQKTEVANADASIAALQSNVTTSRDALAVLLGMAPQELKIKTGSLSDLAVPSISPGQPSQLLQRRPDIKEAEAKLIAANANIGVARAALFPDINLGLAPSIAAAPIANPAVTALQLAASASMPLFNAGRLDAGVRSSEARERELAETYRKTVLTAFQEVEDALAAVKAADKRRKYYAEALTSATRAYDIAAQQFKAGAIDYTSLLVSERTLLSAKDNSISASLDRLTAAIDLYKALGGGWQAEDLIQK